MKPQNLLLVLALGASTCLLTAQDQKPATEGQRPPGREGGPGGPAGPEGAAVRRPVQPIIAALDLNGDGIIDADELAKAAESLKKLDKNGDGKLTPDEFRPPRMGGPGGPGAPGDRPEAQGRQGGKGDKGGALRPQAAPRER